MKETSYSRYQLKFKFLCFGYNYLSGPHSVNFSYGISLWHLNTINYGLRHSYEVKIIVFLINKNKIKQRSSQNAFVQLSFCFNTKRVTCSRREYCVVGYLKPLNKIIKWFSRNKINPTCVATTDRGRTSLCM